jgi:hypothetical protein
VAPSAGCTALPAAPGPFGPVRALTDPGDLFTFGPTAAVDPIDPNVEYVAYNSRAGTDVSVTRDGGVTWTRTPMGTGELAPNIGDPGLAVDPTTGEVWHSYLLGAEMACVLDRTADSNNGIGVVSSVDHGVTWSLPLRPDVGPTGRDAFVDRPAIAARDGELLLAFIAVPAVVDSPATQVVLTRSNDRGQTWFVSDVSLAARPSLRRAVTLAAPSDGSIAVAWFEKQNAVTRRGTVWVSRSTDGGETFQETKVSGDLFAREDGPSMAVSRDGTSLAIVFGASAEEGPAAEDLYVVRSANTGAAFDAPLRLAHACGGVWAPAVTFDSAGDLWGIWYQETTAVSRVGWLRLRNAGAGEEAIELGTVQASESPFTMSRSPLVSLGDFVGLAAGGDVAVATWTSLRDLAAGGPAVHVAQAALRGTRN